jgi:uncharacterized membrane protein
MSTDPSIPPVPPESTPSASPAVVPQVEDKTVAIIAYLTFVGFIVALILNNGPKKNALGQFHLRQALGLLILHLGGMIAFVILAIVFHRGFFGLIVNIASKGYFIGLLVLFILGLVDAINGRRKPIPVLGEFIQQKLAGAFVS